MTPTAAPAAFPRFKSAEGGARYRTAYDAALKAWPVPCETITRETSLGPTHVLASGPPDAPPLLLLPSFAAGAVAWRPNIAALSARRRAYAIDVIGQPGLSQARRRIRHQREFAGWLGEAMDGLGVARAAIVGCSFGGFLALNQAVLTPERVEKAVLIGPAGTFVDFSWRLGLAMRVGALRRRLRRLLGDKRPPQIGAMLGRGAPIHPEDAAWRALMSVTMAEAPKVSVINAHVFSRAELAAVRAPVLLLIGEYERLYDPHATLAIAKARLPGLEGEVIEGADHIAAMSQPEAVNERIMAFLDG